MDTWHETAAVAAAQRITAIRCDPHKDLVWIGDASGKVASYYGPLLRPYTSFVGHTGPVIDLQISDKYVLSLASDGVRSHTRNGLYYDFAPTAQGDVLLLLDNTEFLVGTKHRVKRFTLEPTIKETGTFTIDSIGEDVHLTHMSMSPPNVALGLSNGSVQVVDPHTFDPVLAKVISCHTGPLTDLDSRKNVLVTCGLSQRRYGMFPDVFISCFDTRTRKPLPPLTVNTGASFVRLHPKAPNHVIALGATGQLTFLDSRNATSIVIKQLIVQTNPVGIDIGPLGDKVVVAEEHTIHYWSMNSPQASQDELFKGLDVPSTADHLPVVKEDTPLSAVGMPYYNQGLLSNWPAAFVFETGMPVPDWEKVKSSLIAQKHEPMKSRRTRNRRSSSASVPRFLSEQERLGLAELPQNSVFTDLIKADDSAARGKVPKVWRQMHIHYSRFGVDDFDFSFYNATEYAGLETLSSNPFCNAVLQLYRWCPPVYNATLTTFAENNWRDLTVTGELAIVLDMLAKAKGYHCRATNFIDTLQLTADAAGLHKFLMERLVSEHEEEIGTESPLKYETHIKMMRREYGSCGSRNTTELCAPTLYASSISASGIQAGLTRSAEGRQFCEACNKAHSVGSAQQAISQPPVIFVTLEERDEAAQTSQQRRMSPEVECDTVCSQFGLVPRADNKLRLDPSRDDYELRGYVAVVNDEGLQHAVTVVNIDGVWHLFNDFLVTPIKESEALDFSSKWKKASILMYGRKQTPIDFDDSWKSSIDKRLLYERRIVSGNLEDTDFSAEMLHEGESVPKIVALDAEFVLMRKEIAELHSDGTKSLVAPQKLSLARVSVLREDESVLLDDIVEATQPVIDYLTAFSGIEPGDLNPKNSRHGLVARQTATRRLWILLNLGTTFVGHALINDFRTINLFVPPGQVIDTVNLYYDRDRNGFRRLSLKFLMWAVLGEQVQMGNHDSVQDAVSALRLYHKHQELVATGQLDTILAEVSAKGQKHNFKVPV